MDTAARTVGATSLYEWHSDDFEQAAGSVLAYIGRHANAVSDSLSGDESPELHFLDYDWTLNSIENTRVC